MTKYIVAIGIIIVIGIYVILSITGDGGFKRMVTISGIYSVCKPDGYDVVCFLDADGKEGGMFCLPLSSVSAKGCLK